MATGDKFITAALVLLFVCMGTTGYLMLRAVGRLETQPKPATQIWGTVTFKSDCPTYHGHFSRYPTPKVKLPLNTALPLLDRLSSSTGRNQKRAVRQWRVRLPDGTVAWTRESKEFLSRKAGCEAIEAIEPMHGASVKEGNR